MRSAKDRKNAKVAVQQYTTTAAHLDQLGEQARKLRQEMADATDAVAETREELKGYNERRREQTAKLKEILTPIVRHLQAGGTANGVTGLHNWAAWYNPTAKDGKNAARQIMRIVKGKKKDEGDMTSPLTDLKVGIGSRDYMGRNPVTIGAYGGKMTVCFWREHEETYTAKRNAPYALLDHMTIAVKKNNGHIDDGADHTFTHKVEELEGEFTVEVWMPGASEKEITKALLAKTKDALKALHIKDGYKQVVAGLKEDREDQARYDAEMKEKGEKVVPTHARLGNTVAQCGVHLKGNMVFVNVGDADKVTCAKCKRALQKSEEPQPAAPKTSRVVTYHASDDGYRGLCGTLLKGYAGKPKKASRIAENNEQVNCPACKRVLEGNQPEQPAASEVKPAAKTHVAGRSVSADFKGVVQ